MISTQQGHSLEANARLFAMLYMRTADAVISVWDDKTR